MTVIQTAIPEDLLKFVTLLNNIIRGQDLSTGPQKFGMTRNLVIGESLRVFEQKSRERGTETNKDYGLVTKDLISHSFPTKYLNRQKRYLRRGLYKHRDTKVWDLIFCIAEMVEYLKKFPPFRAGQCLPEDAILELVDF